MTVYTAAFMSYRLIGDPLLAYAFQLTFLECSIITLNVQSLWVLFSSMETLSFFCSFYAVAIAILSISNDMKLWRLHVLSLMGTGNTWTALYVELFVCYSRPWRKSNHCPVPRGWAGLPGSQADGGSRTDNVLCKYLLST